MGLLGFAAQYLAPAYFRGKVLSEQEARRRLLEDRALNFREQQVKAGQQERKIDNARQQAALDLQRQNLLADNARADAAASAAAQERMDRARERQGEQKYRVGRDKVEDRQFQQNQSRLAAGERETDYGRGAYIRQRITALTKGEQNDYGVQITPPMTLEQATAQANREWAASRGETAPVPVPQPRVSPAGHGRASPTQSAVRVPDELKRLADESEVEYAQRLKAAGLDRATAQRYGQAQGFNW